MKNVAFDEGQSESTNPMYMTNQSDQSKRLRNYCRRSRDPN